MSEHQDLAKIKDRITKLLAMAADSSSPNEAAIAMGRARSLMDKYQVSEFDLSGKAETKFASIPLHAEYDDQLDVFKNGLSIAVATYNDCIARYEFGWISRPRGSVKGKRIVLHGLASDCELAVQMYGRLEEAIKRLRADWFKETGTKYSHRLRRNFEDAAAAIVGQRLRAMTAERDTVTHIGTGTSLMVVKAAIVAEHFGEAKYGTAKKRGKIDMEGYRASRAGHEKGSTLEIVPVLAGN